MGHDDAVSSATVVTDVRDSPLSVDEALRAVSHPRAGAVALFVGTVREHDEGREGVTLLDYSAHPDAVARLAGMPPATVQRAKAVLARLEAGRAKTGGLAAGLDDLPLVAAAAQAEEEQCDAIRAEVEAIDVDALTPREALDTLYRLKALAREG